MTKVQIRADTCRAHAQRCRAKAALIQHASLRDQFFDLAQTWESMADQIEELETLRRRLERELGQPNARPSHQAPSLERRIYRRGWAVAAFPVLLLDRPSCAIGPPARDRSFAPFGPWPAASYARSQRPFPCRLWLVRSPMTNVQIGNHVPRSVALASFPLLAQSGRGDRARRCPLLGVKRTLPRRASMSAYDPKRTLGD